MRYSSNMLVRNDNPCMCNRLRVTPADGAAIALQFAASLAFASYGGRELPPGDERDRQKLPPDNKNPGRVTGVFH